MSGTLTILFLVLMFLGMPVAFAIGCSAFLFYVFGPVPASISVQRIASVTQSFPLLAVPLFVFAGHLMNEAGITSRLIKLSTVLTGWIAGGLAQVAIVLSRADGRRVGLGGRRSRHGGAHPRARDAQGRLHQGLHLRDHRGRRADHRDHPAEHRADPLRLHGQRLDRAAVRRRHHPRPADDRVPDVHRLGDRAASAATSPPPTVCRPRGEVLSNIWECKWALLFPVFLILGIRYGIFTPSEAGAFAVAYAIFIGFFVYRELTLHKLIESLRQSMIDNGMIMLIIMFSAMIGYMITLEGVPQAATNFLVSISSNPQVLMLLLVAFITVLGMFLESTVIVLLLTPILVPVITKVGIDPVHFGLVMMTTVTLGGMTPPVGVAMYTVCGMLNCSMDEYTREAIPLIAAVLVLVGILIYFPWLVLVLPQLIF